MSTDPTADDIDGDPAPPLAADRPLVDGTKKTSGEIRAELEQLLEEERQRIEEEPDRDGAIVGPHAAPVTAPPAAAEVTGAGPDGRPRDEPVAAAQHQVERARTAVQERASSLRNAAQQKPGVLAGVAVALVLLLLAWRLLGRR